MSKPEPTENPRAALVSACMAVALDRGGVVGCADAIEALEIAMQRLGRVAPDDPLHDLRAAGGGVVAAILQGGDPWQFDNARNALQLAALAYWRARVGLV